MLNIKEESTIEILIGDILKGVRKCSCITQAEFARQIQVSQSYISKLEKNEASPSVELLDKYAAFFNVEPELFLRFRKLKDSNTLAEKLRIALFRKLVYDSEKDPFNDGTEL